MKSGNYLILTKESSSTHKELKPDPKGHANQSNLERQIQEIMDNNLAIKNNPNTNTAEFEIPAGVSIKIDYLAWFIQLLIWNIVVIIVYIFILQKSFKIVFSPKVFFISFKLVFPTL